MALRDQPYLPLYIDDYLTDERVLMCSDASQGLYIRIMCNFHKQTPYGGIQLKDKDRRHDDNIRDFAVKMANLIPRPVEVLDAAIRELLEENVLRIGQLVDGCLKEIGEYEYATDPTGDFLFQKRMYKAGQISLMRSSVAKSGGGNPALGKDCENLPDTTTKQKGYDLTFIGEPEFVPIVERWLTYKQGRRESYKTAESLKLLYKKLLKLSGGIPEKATEIIDESISNNWAGIFALKNEQNGKFPAKNNSTFSNAQDRRASVSNAKNLAATILCGDESEDGSGRF